jgi:hypothetical protein
MAKITMVTVPSDKRKADMRLGYIQGFTEAVRLSHGMPEGITFRRTWKHRKKLAGKVFEKHWQKSVNGRRPGTKFGIAESSASGRKDGVVPDYKFLMKIVPGFVAPQFEDRGWGKRLVVPYTDQQLKRAFECGASVALGMAMEKISGEASLRELVDTPVDVHETNASLFLWQDIDWREALKWILNPAPPAMRKEKLAAKQLTWQGSAVVPKSSPNISVAVPPPVS